MMRPTTKHSHIGQHSDITPGAYFKAYYKWFRATDAVRPSRLTAFEWEVPALDTDGLQRVVGLPDEIELADDGTTPGPFKPSTLRAKARKLHDQAVQLHGRVLRLHQLADGLELEAKAAK